MAPATRRPSARMFALGLSTLLSAGLLSVTSAAAAAPVPGPTILAVLGDTPYSATQRVQLPALITAVDADPAVSMVLHAGDMKNSTTSCSDSQFRGLASLFGTFDDPFVLTPGDNDWTDCHQASTGRFLPTERLAALRRIFYPAPGRTLGGAPATVTSQAQEQPSRRAYVENVRFVRSGVVLATAHVVGSSNDLQPWSGLVGGDRPAERRAEFDARRAANLAWINAAFDNAVATAAYGVLLMLQAEPVATSSFNAERSLIAQRAAQFGRPVLLVHGDEHRFEVQTRYLGVANLTRLETYGNTASYWLRVTIDPSLPQVFAWQSRRIG
jgi:hypothetical protein